MTALANEVTLRRSREAFAASVEPIAHLLADPTVAEIMLNPATTPQEDGIVWVDVEGKGIEDSGIRLSASTAELLIRTIGSSAAGTRILDADHPVISCQAAHGQFRFEGLIPPAVLTPSFTIRKYLKQDVVLGDYIESGVLSERQADALSKAVFRDEQTVLVGGQTFSGKTTLLNALLQEASLDDSRRMLIIEDTPELEVPEGPSLRLEVRPGSAFGYREAVVSALRQRPNAIVLGELRRPDDAMEALEAWNTGHQGMGTLHAPSCTRMLRRLYSLCRQSESGRHVMHRTISDAVHMVVHLKRVEGRRVADVQRVLGWNGSTENFDLEEVK